MDHDSPENCFLYVQRYVLTWSISGMCFQYNLALCHCEFSSIFSESAPLTTMSGPEQTPIYTRSYLWLQIGLDISFIKYGYHYASGVIRIWWHILGLAAKIAFPMQNTIFRSVKGLNCTGNTSHKCSRSENTSDHTKINLAGESRSINTMPAPNLLNSAPFSVNPPPSG